MGPIAQKFKEIKIQKRQIKFHEELGIATKKDKEESTLTILRLESELENLSYLKQKTLINKINEELDEMKVIEMNFGKIIVK